MKTPKRDKSLFYLLLLEHFDPHVWDGHGQPVVKPSTSLGSGTAQGRHAGHVLCDGDHVRGDVVEHLVGQHEVDQSLRVGVQTKVLVVVACE